MEFKNMNMKNGNMSQQKSVPRCYNTAQKPRTNGNSSTPRLAQNIPLSSTKLMTLQADTHITGAQPPPSTTSKLHKPHHSLHQAPLFTSGRTGMPPPAA